MTSSASFSLIRRCGTYSAKRWDSGVKVFLVPLILGDGGGWVGGGGVVVLGGGGGGGESMVMMAQFPVSHPTPTWWRRIGGRSNFSFGVGGGGGGVVSPGGG